MTLLFRQPNRLATLCAVWTVLTAGKACAAAPALALVPSSPEARLEALALVLGLVALLGWVLLFIKYVRARRIRRAASMARSSALASIAPARRALPEGPAVSEILRSILANADILFWWGHVRRIEGRFVWHLELPPESIHCPLYRLAGNSDRGGIWHHEQLPDLERMDRTARAALEAGAPGYEQEYRLVGRERTHWCSESVRITALGDNEWSLVGVITDVTKRHDNEEARGVLHLDKMLERLDCMVWQCEVVDLGGGRLDWTFDVPVSGLMKRLFDREEAYHTKTIHKGLVVPQLQQLKDLGTAAILGGAPGYENEFQVTKADGEEFWLHEHVSIYPKGKGRWGLVGACLDVSARHTAETARRSAEAQLEQMLNRADCLLWRAKVVARDGAFVWEMFIPPSVLHRRIFGRNPDPQSRSLWHVEQVPNLDAMTRLGQRALTEGLPDYEQEFHIHGVDATYWLHEQVSIEKVGEGEWSLVGIVTDITGRRAAELELAAEKERLDVTLKAMAEGVVTVDTSGLVRFMNRAACELTERPLGESVGKHLSEVCVLEGHKTGETLCLDLTTVLGEQVALEVPPQAQLRTRSGAGHLIEGSLVPLTDVNGLRQGAVLVFRDVTERQQLESQIQRAAKLESIGLLAGGIAHDFNNILTAIMGNLSLLQTEILDGEQGQMLSEAVKASVRARELTQQLLTFSKGGDPVRRAMGLQELVAEVVHFALRGSRVLCDVDASPGLWNANADKGQISQVLHNLTVNASQAMRGVGRLGIRLRNREMIRGEHPALTAGSYLEVSVQDTGPGIDAEHLGRIFDPYFTTKEEGHGLGLATCHSILKRHNGWIEASSTPGEGCTFTFWLPAVVEAGSASEGAAAAGSAPLRRLQGRVLVMDDELPIQRIASRTLRQLGLEVDFAGDGTEALRKHAAAAAEGRAYDLVILDLTVPGRMGGREVMAALRAADPSVRGIVSSGYSSDPVMAEPTRHGFVGVIPKPYEIRQFQQMVLRVLEGA